MPSKEFTQLKKLITKKMIFKFNKIKNKKNNKL